MIYIVTGHPRSGTSMMMEALHAGGIPAVSSKKRDELERNLSDEFYTMNQTGLWEALPEEMADKDFPTTHDGHIVKLVFGCLHFMRPKWYEVSNGSEPLYRPGYRAIVMVRHPEEVRQSMRSSVLSKRENFPLPVDNCREWWKLYGSMIRTSLGFLSRRKDVLSVSVVNYRRLVQEPRRAFEQIKVDGWPINVADATSVVKPELVRFRHEALTVGM